MIKTKAIFHIDNLSNWSLLLKNVSNLLNVIDITNSEVEVLANSEAVKTYNPINYSDKEVIFMKDLNNKGVKFVACNNSLNSLNLKKEDLIEFIDIVPVGVLELIIKQQEGYSYIKP
ncbi:DsrE family protein [Clostridium sp.]|uniref:DsrE family protein n=1 Tax=Clostridium sp. TaxID=1506 RepID=UPI002605F610|nr:DsrE family protein [Clostridium sp.]